MGLFLGLTTLMTTGVPLFSFRFLMAVLVLSAIVGSNNTMGVFVTTTWQGFLALFSLSLVIMQTIPNPLYAKPGALREMGAQSERERERECDPTTLQASPTREELRRVESESAAVRHERPKRFVYGGKK